MNVQPVHVGEEVSLLPATNHGGLGVCTGKCRTVLAIIRTRRNEEFRVCSIVKVQ